jgi:hypothetical protein
LTLINNVAKIAHLFIGMNRREFLSQKLPEGLLKSMVITEMILGSFRQSFAGTIKRAIGYESKNNVVNEFSDLLSEVGKINIEQGVNLSNIKNLSVKFTNHAQKYHDDITGKYALEITKMLENIYRVLFEYGGFKSNMGHYPTDKLSTLLDEFKVTLNSISAVRKNVGINCKLYDDLYVFATFVAEEYFKKSRR